MSLPFEKIFYFEFHSLQEHMHISMISLSIELSQNYDPLKNIEIIYNSVCTLSSQLIRSSHASYEDTHISLISSSSVDIKFECQISFWLNL